MELLVASIILSMCLDIGLPYRMYARVLQHVCAVKVQEDAPDHDHLAAVRAPAVVYPLEEHLPVHALHQELLYVGLHVSFY